MEAAVNMRTELSLRLTALAEENTKLDEENHVLVSELETLRSEYEKLKQAAAMYVKLVQTNKAIKHDIGNNKQDIESCKSTIAEQIQAIQNHIQSVDPEHKPTVKQTRNYTVNFQGLVYVLKTEFTEFHVWEDDYIHLENDQVKIQIIMTEVPGGWKFVGKKEAADKAIIREMSMTTCYCSGIVSWIKSLIAATE